MPAFEYNATIQVVKVRINTQLSFGTSVLGMQVSFITHQQLHHIELSILIFLEGNDRLKNQV